MLAVAYNAEEHGRYEHEQDSSPPKLSHGSDAQTRTRDGPISRLASAFSNSAQPEPTDEPSVLERPHETGSNPP